MTDTKKAELPLKVTRLSMKTRGFPSPLRNRFGFSKLCAFFHEKEKLSMRILGDGFMCIGYYQMGR